MTPVGPERRAALQVLSEVRRGRRLDRALDDVLEGLPDEAGAWVHAATYGVVRLRGRLDHLLDRKLHQGIASVSPLLLDLLRLGAYQLLYMDGVPDYAAISQTVEQAREAVGGRVAGLVNGVLRSVQSDGGGVEAFPDPQMDPVGYLAAWGSHPRWLVERWLERFGRESAFGLVEGNNRIPPLSVRPLGLSVDEAVKKLADGEIEARPVGRGTGCVWIEDGSDPGSVLAEIPAVVQDPGAALVVTYAAPEPGSLVADLCAAPGGKALALAASASRVLAGDLSRRRLALLGTALERLGSAVSPVYRVVARGEIPPVAGADVVLADVPCSGTGTFRRHPDGKWRLEPEDPKRLATIQARILQGVSRAVRPGGLLVYSTCTLESEENEAVVSRFLAETDEFRMEPPDGAAGGFVDAEGFLRVLPQETGFDGAFAARMRKIGG